MKKNTRILKKSIASFKSNTSGFTSKQMGFLKGGGIAPSEPVVGVTANTIVPQETGGAGVSSGRR